MGLLIGYPTVRQSYCYRLVLPTPIIIVFCKHSDSELNLPGSLWKLMCMRIWINILTNLLDNFNNIMCVHMTYKSRLSDNESFRHRPSPDCQDALSDGSSWQRPPGSQFWPVTTKGWFVLPPGSKDWCWHLQVRDYSWFQFRRQNPRGKKND